MKYINDNEDLGIDYDWSLIKKTIKRLGIYPKTIKDPATDQAVNVWNPLHVPFDRAKWFTHMSIRSKGKTTNYLLLGLIMNKLYGTVIQYIVQSDYLLTPKMSSGLFRVINNYHYVERITDGRWHGVVLRARRWYYCNYDENGHVSEMSPDYVMIMYSIDKQDDYKRAGAVEPRGDLIIFDEFIRKYYMPNEFIELSQLIATIRRNRLSPVIVMLSNTVDKNSPYFNELEVYDRVYNMNPGDRDIITSSGGTNVYVEIIDPAKTAARVKADRLFFGFKNKQLGAITGSTVWAERNFQHIMQFKELETITKTRYISHNNKLVNMELVKTELGLCVLLHWGKRTYNDSVIYTLGNIEETLHRYRFGTSRLDKVIWGLYKKNKFYYATNDIGAFVESYIIACQEVGKIGKN